MTENFKTLEGTISPSKQKKQKNNSNSDKTKSKNKKLQAIYTSNLQQSWGAEVSKKKETIGRSDVWLFFCTTPARASLERHFFEWTNSTNQAGISTSSTFSQLSYWNLYFLLTFVLKSLLSLNFLSEISTFSELSYWNLYFLSTFLLKTLLSLNFPIEISTFSQLSYWNLYYLSTFLLKSLLSFYFFIEISTFS